MSIALRFIPTLLEETDKIMKAQQARGADFESGKMCIRDRNSIMVDGKKGVAQSIVYGAFDKIKETTGEEPLEVFEKAMNNIMPVLEVKARRIGGANYQVPIEVRAERRQTLGLRWLTKYLSLIHI